MVAGMAVKPSFMDWAFVDRLKDSTSMRLLLKGIVSARRFGCGGFLDLAFLRPVLLQAGRDVLNPNLRPQAAPGHRNLVASAQRLRRGALEPQLVDRPGLTFP